MSESGASFRDIRGEPGRKLTWQTIATVNEFIRASERFETRQIYAKDMCIKARTCLFAVSLVVSGSIKKYLVGTHGNMLPFTSWFNTLCTV